MKRNIKLKIAYDGTDFCGWQIQANQRTVQGEIERALKQIHGKQIRLTGSGRTDSGVHANGQIANFYTDSHIPSEKYKHALNSLLKNDLYITESTEVSQDFHARFNAKERIYYYYIKTENACLPNNSRYCWCISQKPDINRLNRLAAPLIGIHNFSTFTAAGDNSSSKTRNIYSAGFYPHKGFIIFKISGNAFLWKMVRSITGTIIELESKKALAQDMKKILKSKDRKQAGTTAPARGLFLDRVNYE